MSSDSDKGNNANINIEIFKNIWNHFEKSLSAPKSSWGGQQEKKLLSGKILPPKRYSLLSITYSPAMLTNLYSEDKRSFLVKTKVH